MPTRRRDTHAAAAYPRMARVNKVLREVLGDELERLADVDDRLRLLTVTGVDTTADLRHATVFLASLPEAAAEALAQERAHLQQAVGRQVRLKRTPHLEFRADPAVVGGERVEQLLRRLHQGPTGTEPGDGGGPAGAGTEPGDGGA